MLKIHLKYSSETARRAKDKAIATKVERAFGKAVDARKGPRRIGTSEADEESD
jgi:hypothetical protein